MKVAGLQILLKRDSTTGVLFRTPTWRTSANGYLWFFKTATEQQWAVDLGLTLLSSDNLLTGYEQLSY